ncbi:MAG: winged helix-turn-helix domain-containing protein [Pseudomonadota bacterium]
MTQTSIIVCRERADGVCADALAACGLQVRNAQSASQLRVLARSEPADAIIIDLSTAERPDAMEPVRWLAAHTPMIIVAIVPSDDPVDRVIALESGADECLSAPADPREIVTRIRALQRRMATAQEAGRAAAGGLPAVVRLGRFSLDLEGGRLLAPGGSSITLTALELQLLKTFVAHPNRVLNRDELCEMAHGRTWSPLDRSLDIRISRLRQKIEDDAAQPKVIVTVRGVGYRFDMPAV